MVLVVGGPLLVGGGCGGQGREQPVRADRGGQAEGLEPDEQVLPDAGQGKDGAVAGQLIPQRSTASSAVKPTSTLASTFSTNQRGGPWLPAAVSARRRKSWALAKNSGASYRYKTRPGMVRACG